MSAPDPLRWIADVFADDPTYFTKGMFGCRAIYLGSRLVLATTARPEPWNGLLCPTERHFHPELRALFPALEPHRILPKWLYLSRSDDAFEPCAMEIAEMIRQGDRRFGVEGGIRAKRRR